MNKNCDEKFCTLTAIPEDITEFKLNKISYTMFNTLRCPLKYYINYVIGIKDYNRYTIIGVIVHACYEYELMKYKNGTYDDSKIFDFVTTEFLDEMFLKQFNKIDFDNIKPIILKQKRSILNTIKSYLSKAFIRNLIPLIEKEGYELGIESENSDKTVKFLNSDLILYTRSDIVLYNDKTVEVYDIKCGNIDLNYKNQLIFCSFNFITPETDNNQTFRGYIFSTKYKKLRCIFVDEMSTIKDDFNKLIQTLNILYERLGIVNIRHIKYYIENQISEMPENKLFEIHKELIEANGISLCKNCKLLLICPFKLGCTCNDFNRLVSGNNERIIGLSVAKPDSEIII